MPAWRSGSVAGDWRRGRSARPGARYANQFPKDYSFLYGTNRPFAPSLARTDTGGAFDAQSLAGSETCGTSGCHDQILREWQPSAHRYAAMDKVFLGIQDVMAKQAEFAKKAMEAAIANTKDMAELVQKSSTEAFKIVQDRMKESYEEIRTSVEKKS